MANYKTNNTQRDEYRTRAKEVINEILSHHEHRRDAQVQDIDLVLSLIDDQYTQRLVLENRLEVASELEHKAHITDATVVYEAAHDLRIKAQYGLEKLNGEK